MKKERKLKDHENQSDLPAAYLRKAWFIILNDVKLYADEYFKLLPVDWQEKSIKWNPKSDIQRFAVKKESFGNDLERTWYDKVQFEDGTNHDIGIKHALKIVHGAFPAICTAISVATGITRNAADKGKKPEPANAKSTVQTKIHHFLSAGEEIKSGRDRIIEFEFNSVPDLGRLAALAIVRCAQKIVNDRNLPYKSDEMSMLSFMESKIIEHFNLHRPPRDVKAKFVPNPFLRFWHTPKANFMLDKNAFWIQYERIDLPEGTKDFGLSSSVVYFQKSEDGHLICTLYKLSHVNSNTTNKVIYSGLATFDEGNWLHANLRNTNLDTHPSLSSFTMRFHDKNNQEIMLGHYHFYAVSRTRYLSKTVVWERKPLPADINGQPDQDWIFNNFVRIIDLKREKEKVHKSIQSFLRNRSLNRLTMPSVPIYRLEGHDKQALNTWITLQNDKPEDQSLESCCGEYYVVYHHGDILSSPKVSSSTINKLTDQEIILHTRFDNLKITKDEYRNDCHAKFEHENVSIHHYVGEVLRKKLSVEIILEQVDIQSEKTGQRNLVLLTFSIPDDERGIEYFRKELYKLQFLQGVISGLSDKGLKSVAFKALVVSKEKLLINQEIGYSDENTQPKIRQEVISYFKNNAGNLGISAGPL